MSNSDKKLNKALIVLMLSVYAVLGNEMWSRYNRAEYNNLKEELPELAVVDTENTDLSNPERDNLYRMAEIYALYTSGKHLNKGCFMDNWETSKYLNSYCTDGEPLPVPPKDWQPPVLSESIVKSIKRWLSSSSSEEEVIRWETAKNPAVLVHSDTTEVARAVGDILQNMAKVAQFPVTEENNVSETGSDDVIVEVTPLIYKSEVKTEETPTKLPAVETEKTPTKLPAVEPTKTPNTDKMQSVEGTVCGHTGPMHNKAKKPQQVATKPDEQRIR